MFGLFRTDIEKAVILAFARQFEGAGFAGGESKQTAKRIVDEVASDIRRGGMDLGYTSHGNTLASDTKFTSPRLAAGLQLEDIRSHWNRPLLLAFGELKMRDGLRNIAWNIAVKDGSDFAKRHYKATFPRYGDPDMWDPGNKLNEWFTATADSYIYPEFARRVDAWSRKHSAAEVKLLATAQGSLNALIRTKVAAQEL